MLNYDLMKSLFFQTLQVVLVSFIACPSLSFANSVPDPSQGIGRGIQNERTRQTLLLACAEQLSEKKSIKSCDQVRFLKMDQDHRAEWLWNGFHAGDSTQIEIDLKLIYKRALESEVVELNSERRLKAFTNQKGWNWAQVPITVTDKQYQRLLSLSQAYAEARNHDVPQNRRTTVDSFEVGDPVLIGGKLEEGGKITRILENDTFELNHGTIVDGRNLSLSLYSDKDGISVNDTVPIIFHHYVVYATVMRLSDAGYLLIVNPLESNKWYRISKEKIVSHEPTPLKGSKVYLLNSTWVVPYTISEYDKNNDSFIMNEYYYGKEIDISRSELYFSASAPQGFHLGQKVWIQLDNDHETRQVKVTDFIRVKGQTMAVLDNFFFKPVSELSLQAIK